MSPADNGVLRTAQPGRVTAVRGPVVEAEFAEADLPSIYEALRLRADGREVFLEVSLHISPTGVRAIVLGHPEGLARGMAVERTGGPVRVPVGPATLGRLFNVLGDPLDHLPAPTADRMPIHRASPPLTAQRRKVEFLETGIKVIDLLAPLARGGKAGLIGGAGVGKTVLLQELIRTMTDRPRRRRGVRGRRGADARGERPLARDAADRGDRPDRPGLRPDERGPRLPVPGRPLRPHDGRVLPRRRTPGRDVPRRQRVPVRPGRVGGVRAARPDAVGDGLPADPGRRPRGPRGAGGGCPAARRSPRCRRSTSRRTT